MCTNTSREERTEKKVLTQIYFGTELAALVAEFSDKTRVSTVIGRRKIDI